MSTADIPVPGEGTPEPHKETEIQEITLHIPYPDSFIYSNCASFSISQMDIRIGFAEAMPDRTAQPRVGIVMAPEHAAILALALMGQVHAYEHNFGPIRAPQWQEQKAKAIEAIRKSAGESHRPTAEGPSKSSG